MIRIRTLGSLELAGSDGTELRAVLTQPKRFALFVYLALASPHGFRRRDELLGVFWPELDHERARAALGQAVHFLRKALGADAIVGRGTHELGLADGAVWCDAVAFERALDTGDVEQAMELYRGDLLVGFFVSESPVFERWLETERARLGRRAAEAALASAETRERAGDRAGAARLLRRALTIRPYDEAVLRRLMAVLQAAGERAAAIETFDEFAGRLRRELEVDPAPETAALADEIRNAQGQVVNAISARRTPEFSHAVTHPRLPASARGVDTVSRAPPDRAPPPVWVRERRAVERTGRRQTTRRVGALVPRIRVRRSMVVTVALVLAAAAALAAVAMFKRPAEERPRLAVLPFRDIGGGADRAFAEGVAEEIAARLSGVSGIRVMGRQTVLYYADSDRPIERIVAELDVDFVLSATVHWDAAEAERRVKLIVSLEDADDRSQVWAQVFDDTVTGLFDVQTRIAENVVDRLGVHLAGRERRALVKPYTGNAEAHQHYLVGTSHFSRYFPHSPRLEMAIGQFERAVALDPTFAAAYAKLAMAHASLYARPGEGREEHGRRAREAARRALELDPRLPDAIAAQGIYAYWVERDRAAAEREMERVLAIEPDNIRALVMLTDLYRRRGDFPRAGRAADRAAEVDPHNARVQYEAALTAMFQRRFDDMARYVERHRALEPSSPEPLLLGALRHLLQHGDVDSARAALRQGEGRHTYPFLVALAAGRDGLTMHALARSVWNAEQAGRFPLPPGVRDTAPVREAHYFLQRARLTAAEGSVPAARAHYDSALTLLETRLGEPTGPWHNAVLGEAYAGVGRRDSAVAAARRAVAVEPVSADAYSGVNWLIVLAETYARTRERGAALDHLATLLDEPAPVTAALLRVDPLWESFRADPRFRRLLGAN